MHEDLAAVVAGEEAIPLVGVVPLDLAGRHARTSRRKRTRTTSDQATDRMLWALLRLSVRGTGSQLLYRLPSAPVVSPGPRANAPGKPRGRSGDVTSVRIRSPF